MRPEEVSVVAGDFNVQPGHLAEIKNTAPWKPSVSEVTKESGSTLIHSQENRLAPGAELFRKQFS